MAIVSKVLGIQGKRLVSGDVGVEIEVEGDSLPKKITGWRTENDGSLRGESFEYVLKTPATFEELPSRLAAIETAYKAAGTHVHDSVRAGIHVHVNVQQLTLIELFNYLTLCIVFEDLLIEFCGESRTGNLFCLRTKDAQYLNRVLQDVAQTTNFKLFDSDAVRYSFMNPKSIFQYGSLEFRSLKSTRDWDQILTWVGILLRLREVAKTFYNPQDIITGFSGQEVAQFRERVLGEFFDTLNFPGADKKVFDSMRYAQDLAFCTDWNSLRTLGENNPFLIGDMQVYSDSAPLVVPNIQSRPKKKFDIDAIVSRQIPSPDVARS